jgi:hypothetical protein
MAEIIDAEKQQEISSQEKRVIGRPFPKGVSGNPNGRPPSGQALTDIMREVLEEDLPSGKKRKEALVRKVLELAYEGNEGMVRLAWSYLEGNPRQAVDMTFKELPKPIIGNGIQDNNSNKEDLPTK